MSGQHQTTKSQADKQIQPKNRPAAESEKLEGQVTDVGLPPNLMLSGDTSLQAQADRLSDTRFRMMQRQAMAVQLSRTAGNQYLQRVVAHMQTVMRDDVPPDEGVVELKGGGSSSGASEPTPSFDHSGGKTVTINADTAIEFANNITAAIGSPHTQPEFTPDIQYGFKTDSSGQEIPGSQKITSIGLAVKTSIVKVRYGSGRPNAEHKKAIDEMVAAIKAHEEAHRAIVETAATAALAAAQKYVGTNKVKEAHKDLTTGLECTTNKKHEALDSKEGLLTANEQADGTVTVTKSASGATYPCPE